MPRALTEQDKCRLCNKLLEKGKPVVLSQGVKKISVDDITKAAGMAKGSFYQHFESKEKYLYELIKEIHKHIFAQAEQIITGGEVQTNIRGFLMNIFQMPEMVFLTGNYYDIKELFDSLPEQEVQSLSQMEIELFTRLMALAGINTKKVKPGVVHNYFHTICMMAKCDFMIEEDLPKTLELITDSLISYAFPKTK